MMSYWKFHQLVPSLSIPMEKSICIGVWLNEASKLDGHWLLHIRIIPVYVIHTYLEDVDSPVFIKSIQDCRQQDYNVDFISHTCAKLLNSPTQNSYLMASQAGHQEASMILYDGSQQVAQFDHDEISCAYSASWSFWVAQHENNLPVDDIPRVLSMDMTCTSQDSRLAGIAQVTPYLHYP